jgi:hypothetical protein
MKNNIIKEGKYMNKIVNFFVLSALCAVYLNAQTDVDAQLRLRFEMFENMNDKFYGENPKLGVSDDKYLLSRIRLGLTHSFSDEFRARVSIQDSRVFGWDMEEEDWYNKEFGMQNNPQQDELELSETFLEYKNSGFTTTLGRQKIAYGDYRVFGPGEWKNSGKWVWDALKVSYKKDNNFVDIFYGGTMLHEPDKFSLSHRHGYVGGGLYGHYEYTKTAAIEPILAYKYNRDGNELYKDMKTYYGGLRAYDKNIFDFFYDATYIKAIGDKTLLDETSVDIDAQAYHIEGGYNIKGLKIKLALAYTYADPTFDAVFGASDKYYGRLNLFAWSNIKDYELHTIIKPLENVNIKLEYHKFYAPEPTNKWKSYTIASMQNDHYGDEIDAVLKYKYSKNIGLLFGACYFMAGDFIEEASTKNTFITDDDAYGLFTQFTYTY